MSPAAEQSFRIVDRVGDPAEMVTDYLDAKHQRLACFVAPSVSALVLGSSQDEAAVSDKALRRYHLTMARRRSGGTAVLVAPQQQLWLDVFVPKSDELFHFDVCRASWWLGELWRSSFIACGLLPEEITVHYKAMQKSPFSKSVCFLGKGPGEVLLNDKKLVGISQRRDRNGAWFFSMAMVTNHVKLFGTLFQMGGEERRLFDKECDASTVGLEQLGIAPKTLRDELAQRLRNYSASSQEDTQSCGT